MGKRPVITFGNTSLKAERSNYVSLSAEYSNRFLTLSVMGYMNFVDNMIVKVRLAGFNAKHDALMVDDNGAMDVVE